MGVRNEPVYAIGAIQIDRNNNLNQEDAKKQLITLVKSYTTAIKNVSKRINLNKTKDEHTEYGDIYIEDINTESDFTLVNTIVESVLL